LERWEKRIVGICGVKESQVSGWSDLGQPPSMQAFSVTEAVMFFMFLAAIFPI
jgi:hypothetical protein